MTTDETCPADRHGTVYAYRSFGCRCPDARAAVAVEKAAWRKRRYLTGPQLVSCIGTTRRIQALMWMGWPARDIAATIGYARSDDLLGTGRPMVHRETARAVAEVYDRLSMTPGPSDRVRAIAARRGYAPPLAWTERGIDDPWAVACGVAGPVGHQRRPLDEIAIDEAVRGRPVALSPGERREAVRRLVAAGLTQMQVAERLGVTLRTVQRVVGRVRGVAA